MVLLVEDDDAIREVLTVILEAEGYRVEAAADGREALAFLERSPPPSLILLDLMMPRMNGWELIARLREASGGPSVPVVVCSASGARRLRAVAPSVVATLSKPYDYALLIETVARHATAAL